MAGGRDGEPLPASEPVDLRPDDRIMDEFHEPDTGRSNFVAFLLGGVVIAGGMLAFMYYDTDTVGMRGAADLTTGSISRLEAPGMKPAPNIVVPDRPLDGSASPAR